MSSNALSGWTLLGAAWVRSHSSHIAAIEIALAGVGSLLAQGSSIERLGPVYFPFPVLLSLCVAIVAGIGVSTAAVREFSVGMPDPARAKATRIAWVASWLGLGSLAVLIGDLLIGGGLHDESAGALARNVLVTVGVSLPLATVGQAQLLWLPPVVLTLAAAMFGFSASTFDWYWWAATLSPSSNAGQLLGAAGLCFCSMLFYGLRRPDRTQRARGWLTRKLGRAP